MNDHEYDDDRDEELARRLRGLPRQMVPPARAWARVAERIGREGRAPTLQAGRTPHARRRRRAVAGIAAAASVALLLAVGLLQLPESGPVGPVTASATERQAERLTGEYRAALAAVPVEQVPEELQPALAELDRSAASILAAIHEAPGSGFLLGQLQRTYAQRLQLTRQAALGAAALLS